MSKNEKVNNIPILFENNDLIVIDKPAGWIVNQASTTTTQPVIEDWIEQNFKFEIFEYLDMRHGIVHRLDKETSGCLIIAKNEKSFRALQAQFKQRIVKKKYLALAHGKLKTAKGEITASVGRLPWRRDRFGVLAGGRDATTGYKLVKTYHKEKDDFSLIELSPLTGRTHQIRIHLKYLGHPIVSDTFYAGRKTARRDRNWCPRLFLHAYKVDFNNPTDGKKIKIMAPVPPDLQGVLDKLS